MVGLSTGHYGTDSLHYLMATGLWMDLGDVLTAYRTVADRLRLLLKGVRAGRVTLTPDELAAEMTALESRRLSELSGQPLREMADNLLHRSWRPTTSTVAFTWAWTTGQDGRQTINFIESGDLRESVFEVIGETVDQIVDLARRLTAG